MKKKVLKIKYRNVLIILFSIIFLFSCGKLLFFYINLRNAKIEKDDLIKNVVEEKEIIPEEKEETTDTFIVDFSELKKINSDVKGWIRYNDKKIDYPIVQGKDNEYYLKHTIQKKYNDSGSIFLDYRNDYFNDKNTVLFGHSMLDDSMFGSLRDMFKDDFFDNEEHNYIKIKDENNKLYLYKIFSYYVIEKEEYYITTKFNSDNEYNKFIDVITRRSYKKFDINVSNNDKILTLSTCYGSGGTTKRKVVHAVLVE